jgi:DNA-binding LacI/PurR family transcriptional regulator
MSLTQHEIVSRLGISRGTLHRVLSDSPLVKTSTRERVLEELKKLNYVPNAIAQGLKTRTTRTIGLVGPASLRMSNIDKLNAIYHSARSRGYSITLGYSDGSAEADAQCIRELRARMVDGFIAIGRGLEETVPVYSELARTGIPLVTLYPLPNLDVDCVYVDTRRAYREMTQHFVDLGHTQIGLLINSSRSLFTVNRELGFRDAMDNAGLSVREEWIIRASPDADPGRHDEAGEIRIWDISDYQYGYWGMSVLLARRKRPTAILCLSDENAIGALRAADEAGVSVPGEIALMGYDDKEPARFARVPLSTMRQPDEKVGAAAVTLLVDRIENRLPKKRIVRPLTASLVIRNSCGARPPAVPVPS